MPFFLNSGGGTPNFCSAGTVVCPQTPKKVHFFGGCQNFSKKVLQRAKSDKKMHFFLTPFIVKSPDFRKNELFWTPSGTPLRTPKIWHFFALFWNFFALFWVEKWSKSEPLFFEGAWGFLGIFGPGPQKFVEIL